MLVLAGCAYSPAETLEAYRQAAREDDADAAYALLAPALKNNLSKAEFLAQWPEVRAQIGRGKVDESLGAHYHALLTTSSGHQVRLRFDGTRWRLGQGALPPVQRRTPREAVALFVYGMQTGNYELVRQVVPSNERDLVSAEALRQNHEQHRVEMDATLEALRGLDNGAYHERGNEAFLVYGDREMLLTKEDDGWVIVEVSRSLLTAPQ